MKKINFGKDKNIIYEKLKYYRKKAHLSQGELAAKMQTMNVNIDQQMISKIENNTRIVTDYELICFSKIFKLEVKALINESDNDLL